MRKMLSLWTTVLLLATTGLAQTTVTINLYDSYGDGWNGGNLNIGGTDYTIDDGTDAVFTADLEDGTYNWAYTPGSWASENSWYVEADGAELISGEGANGEQGGTFTLGGNVTAIYDIQFSEDAANDYPSPLIGTEVTVIGWVTAVKYNGINIQDSDQPWSGIWVYSGTGSTVDIAIGDIVQVTGDVEEYNLLTEIICDSADVLVIGESAGLPTIVIEDLADVHDESLEGMLVWVEGTSVDEDADTYGQWDIEDSSGSVQIEDHYIDWDPILGAYYEMYATVGQSSYDTGYEVAPIDSSAIWETPPCTDNLVFIEMYDAYGDGWNGNVLTIGADSLTVETGDYAAAELCLVDGSYPVTCGGGSWVSEVSWVVYDSNGDTLLAGGAPFEGALQLGETDDVLGCTDPDAYGYDESANVDDGSCWYDGDSCNVSLGAMLGENTADGAPVWYSFTASLTGTAEVSSEGSGVDTQVYGLSGTCNTLVEVGFGDDEFTTYESYMEFDITSGETYYIFWTDAWSADGFVWTLEESLPATSPENLTAEAGLEVVGLMWDGIAPESGARNTSARYLGEIGSNIQANLDVYNAKKASIIGAEYETHSTGMVYQKASRNSRSADVTIVCDGGSWQSEVSWEIQDADGAVVASGGAPDSLSATLEDGSYFVFGYDSFGDGWNGNVLSVTDDADGTEYVNFTIEDGDAGSASFTIGTQTDFPNLTLSNMYYDYEEDALNVTVNNTGTLATAGFYITYYLLNATDGECNNTNYEAFSWVESLAADSSYEAGVGPDILAYMGGYGTYEFGAQADYQCVIAESNEEDNTLTETLTLVDPFEGVTWNIYRSDAGADFASLVSGHDMQDYTDMAVTGDVEYCYYVTQVDSEGAAESDTSNHACATPIAPVALPVPTGLVADADGFNVMVNWVAPDLTDYDPVPPYDPSTGTKVDDPSTYIDYVAPGFSFLSRQGGETVDDAVAIDALPYNNTGTTAGYTDDYDEACPYTGSTSPDVVYSFTPTADAIIDVSLCGEGTSYDTKVYVYENEAGALASTVDLGEASACNDDECENSTTSYLSFLPGVMCEAGNTYYIVVDGYGGASGNYEIDIVEVAPPSPVLGYNVYRDDVMVGATEGGESTSWGEFMSTEGTYTYHATAMYDVFGESAASNSDTATVVEPPPACNAPQNLVAEANSNDVMLMWDAPDGGPSWFGYYNGEFNGGIGTGEAAEFECAASFGSAELVNYNGMTLTHVAFAPNEVAATYTAMIYDISTGTPVPVDSSELFDGADLVMGEFLEVELLNPITIDWTVGLTFGVKINTTTGYPAGMDTGPADAGQGDLMLWGGTWISIANDFGLDYNWALEGYADYGTGRSLTSMTPINVDYTVPVNVAEVTALTLETPISVSTSSSRTLTNYIVYRDDAVLDTTGIGGTEYSDMDAPWGEHTYHVTSLYNNSEDCGESGASNTATVDLFNNPPPAVTLLQPDDNITLIVTSESLGDDFPFIWSSVNDPDNDPVMYSLMAMHDNGMAYDTVSSQAGWFPSVEEIAGDQIADSVGVMTYVWNVHAHDPWDSTASSNGPRSLTVDVSAITTSLDGMGIPDVFALHNNYPNPFNPVTNITYDIPEVAEVKLDIYNVAGQKVRTLTQGHHEPGRYRIQWNATNDFGQQLSSGMYIYRIVAGDFVSVKKLILMK